MKQMKYLSMDVMNRIKVLESLCEDRRLEKATFSEESVRVQFRLLLKWRLKYEYQKKLN